MQYEVAQNTTTIDWTILNKFQNEWPTNRQYHFNNHVPTFCYTYDFLVLCKC